MTSETTLTLHTYWRSSASYRVRMALNLKRLEYAQVPVHLVRDGGQQHSESYARLNPQRQVPALVHGDRVLTQSLAIIEYLDETFPDVPLLPGDRAGRARVRSLAAVVACDIHPLNNLRVLQYITGELGADEQAKLQWYHHWTRIGMDALEALLASSPDTGRCCHGDEPSLADCCLLPQLYNVRRFGVDESGWPEIVRIAEHLETIPAVRRAAPENQPDAE